MRTPYDEAIDRKESVRAYLTVRALLGLSDDEINELVEKNELERGWNSNGKHPTITDDSLRAYYGRVERRKTPDDNELLNMVAVAALLQMPIKKFRRLVRNGKIKPSVNRDSGKKYEFFLRELKKQPYFMELYKEARAWNRPEQPPLFAKQDAVGTNSADDAAPDIDRIERLRGLTIGARRCAAPDVCPALDLLKNLAECVLGILENPSYMKRDAA